MASNLERFSGYIGGKVKGAASDFAAGAKASVYSANPAMFGGIESGVTGLKNEFMRARNGDEKRARQERAQKNRERGFQEEQRNEQRYADEQQQKIFKSMDDKLEQILKALLRGKDGGDSLLGGLPLLGLGFKGPGKTPPRVPGVDGKTPPRVSDVDGKKPPRVPDVDGKKPPKIVDPELKKIRLRGLGFFDDIVKSFEKMKTSLFKTSIKFPELERYATSMADDMGKSVKAIGDMSDSIKASRESLLAKFGPQTGKGGKALSGAALDSRLGKLAGEADNLPKLMELPGEGKAGGAVADAAKGGDILDSMSKATKAFSAEGAIGKVFKGLAVFAAGMGKAVAGPLKLLVELTDIGQFAKGIGKVLGPIGIIFGIFDGLMNALDTEGLAETLGKDVGKIGMQERISGFIGGFIGSIGGLFDLVSGLMGIELEGKSIQKKMTDTFTKFFDDIFEELGIIFKAVGEFLQSEPVQIVFDYIKDMTGNFMKGIVSIFKLLAAIVTWDVDKMKSAGIDLSRVITNSFKALGNVIIDAINYLINKFNNLLPGSGIGTIDRFEKSGPVEDWTDRDVDAWLAQNTQAEVSEEQKKQAEKKQRQVDNAQANYIEVLNNQRYYDVDGNVKDDFFGNNRRIIDTAQKKFEEALEAQRLWQSENNIDNTKYDQVLAEQNRRAAAGADPVPSPSPAAGTETSEEGTETSEEGTEKPPEEQPPTKGDTTEQTDAITTATTDVGNIINDGNVEAMDNAAELSEAERLQQEALAVANADHQANLNSEMQRAYHVGVDRMLAGQSELMRSLVGPLLKGEDSGGPLGNIFGSIFGKDSKLGKIGDVLGSFLGKGEGGLFDKISETFGSIKETVSDFTGVFKDFFADAKGSGTDLAGTFGGSFQGNFTGSKLGDLIGSKLSGELGFEGNANSAVYAFAKDLAAPGGGFSNFSETLNHPSFAGGLNAISALWNGAPVSNARGAIGAGLNIYSLIKGGAAGGIIGGGIANLGSRMVASQAAKMYGQQGLAALSQAGMGNAALSGAAKTGLMGKAGSMLGNFGAGMQSGAATGFNLTGGLGQSTVSGTMGAAAGAIGNGMMTYAIANMLSGGYEINKHLNKIAGAVGAFFGPVGSAVVGVVMGGLNRLFGRKAKKVTATGLDIELGTETTGQQYSEWIKKGGKYRSDKKGTDYSAMDQGLIDFFSDAAGELQTGIGKLADVMGMGADDVVGFTKAYKIDLTGMSAKEQQKAIADAMMTYASDAIKMTYGDVSRFAKEGESTLDTFGRMASATENVAYWFDALGYTAEKTNDMFNKMAENDGLFSAGNGMFNFNFEDTPFYKNMISQIGGEAGASALDYEFAGGRGGPNGYGIDIYSLMNARAMAAAASAGATPVEPTEEQKKLAIAGAKANFVEMLGGQQMFGKTMQGYFSTFYSKEEQAEFMARQATIQAKAALDAVEAELESLSDQFSEIDPNVAESLDNIKSQKEVDEAKENYRKAIESAMESGDMALAAELLKSSEVFMQAANLQLQAAEMNGNATKEQVDLFSDMSEFGSGGGGVAQMKDTRTLNEIEETALGQIVGGGLTSNNVSAGEFDTNVGSGVAALAAEGVVEVMNNNSGTGSADNLVVGGTAVENQNVISSNPAIIGSNNMTSNDVINNVNIANVGVRDFNPMLAVNVRGITMGHIGIGSM